MIRWESLFVLSVLGAAMTACCCSPCEALFAAAEFTAGDFPDVPAYPGATQTTETSAAINALVAAMSLIVEDSEWKHYTTDDPVSAVLDWYSEELPVYGWVEADVEEVRTGALSPPGGILPPLAVWYHPFLSSLDWSRGGYIVRNQV